MAKPEIRTLPPLIVYTENEEYCQELKKFIMEDGAHLSLVRPYYRQSDEGLNCEFDYTEKLHARIRTV